MLPPLSGLERLVRLLACGACVLALGAYLALGDLKTSFDAEPRHDVFLVVSLVGLAGVVALVGWHAVWLVPAAAAAFGVTFETCFWTAPPGVGDGMDSIAFYPSSVLYLVGPVALVAALMAAVRTLVLRHRRTAEPDGA